MHLIRLAQGINARNQASDPLSLYPDLGTVAIDSMQIEADIFETRGDVSGITQPGAERSAVIFFDAPEGKTIALDQVS
ncbi:MAG: hypothetical protein K6T91_01915 [Firmicutes bacterium]|nr:hypothetical protein [Bacillota bacterium]